MPVTVSDNPAPKTVGFAVLTISDTRDESTDTSGAYLIDAIREADHAVIDRAIVRDEKEAIALKLEEVALSDSYFIDRKLYPNVDFYSGLIYQALGFPVDMFTVLFAIPRTVGWLAHWQELLNDPAQKISRPRQWYAGVDERDYVAIDAR